MDPYHWEKVRTVGFLFIIFQQKRSGEAAVLLPGIEKQMSKIIILKSTYRFCVFFQNFLLKWLKF